MDKRRINVRAIIWHQGKLFAVKHKSKNGGEAAYWCLPGGGLDPLESLEEGVIREMVEETGITPRVGRLLFGQQFKSNRAGRDEELEFFFHVTNAEDYLNIDLSNTSHGTAELARCDFIDSTKENILPSLLQTMDIEAYVGKTLPVQIINNLHEDTK